MNTVDCMWAQSLANCMKSLFCYIKHESYAVERMHSGPQHHRKSEFRQMWKPDRRPTQRCPCLHFVFELWTLEPLELVKKFTKANKKSLKNVMWVMWANSQEQSRDIDPNIMNFALENSFVYYEIWFDDKVSGWDCLLLVKCIPIPEREDAFHEQHCLYRKQWIGMFNLEIFQSWFWNSKL